MSIRNNKLYKEMSAAILKHLNTNVLPTDIDILLNEIKENNSKYGIVWPETKSKENFENDIKHGFIPILQKNHELSFSENQDLPQNLLIEGDNYYSLKILQATHQQKIDVIYIDPPYNTGNKDFKYNDRYVDIEDGYRHSKWLSFMYKRLKLAHKLLKDTGCIFISIDDNEFAQLKLLCDEIFGEENFISNLIWKKKNGGGNDSKFIINEHEYILVYGKNVQKTFFQKDKKASVKLKYSQKDDKGFYQLEKLDKQSLGYVKSLDFPIFDSMGNQYLPKQKDPNNPNARWRWAQSTVQERYDELVFKNGSVYTKNYKKNEYLPTSILYDERFGRTQSGKILLQKIIGKDSFSYPKSLELIKHLLRISADKNAIVLDFFAGSGTTAHAILEINKEDNGNRKFILCTNNENDICQQVTYKRLKNISLGYHKISPIQFNLDYFIIDTVKNDINNFQKILSTRLKDIIFIKEGFYSYKEIYENKDFCIYENKNQKIALIYDADAFVEQKENNFNQNIDKFFIFNQFKNNRFDMDNDEFIVKQFKFIYPNATIEIIPKHLINIIVGITS